MIGTGFGAVFQNPRRCVTCLLAFASLAFPGRLHSDAHAGQGKALPQDHSVQIFQRKYGSTVTLYAQLTNCSEATITLELTLENMSASTGLPLTVDAAGRSRFDLVTIRPTDTGKRWSYVLRYQFEIGRRGNLAASTFTYALPYVGERYQVIQGPLGSFSHQAGSRSENAIDWAMPIGSTVCAARDGTVVAIRQDSDIGGPDLTYQPCGNYVVVRHDDGTFAEYVHLERKGVLATLGQKVKMRDPLALSGNTGRSSEPHLHFAVFCTIDGNTRKTLPVQFMTTPDKVEALKQGARYP